MSDTQAAAASAAEVANTAGEIANSNPETGGDSAESSSDDGALFAEAMQIAKGSKGKETAPSPTTSAAETDKAQADGPAAEEKSAAKKDEPTPKALEWAKLHEQKKQLFTKESELKSREAKLADFEKAARTDKLKALELLGYTDAVQFIKDVAETNGQVSPERSKMSQLEKELQALREEKENERKSAESAAEQSRQKAAVDKLNNDIVEFLKNDPKYSKGLVSIPGGAQAVFQEMASHFQKTQNARGEGEALPFAKAAEAVEKQWEAGLLKFAEHPRGREILTQALNKSKSTPGAASPKQPQKSAPIQQRARQVEPELDGEKLLAEATAMMRKNRQARQEA